MKMKVIIYSAVDVFYYSFYIEGFYRVFGRKQVKFRSAPFPKFPERTFAALVEKGNEELKIIIDAYDSPRIMHELAHWSDVYGKVNYSEMSIPVEFSKKVIPIGPSFGVKIWNFPQLIYHLIFNYLDARSRIFMKDNFFKNYWRQFKRLPEKRYQKKNLTKDNYVYFISSLWQKESRLNHSRAKFITACKNIDHINFEGGFAPRSDHKTLGYEKLIASRINLKDYLKRIEKSLLVFNTPAVENCHGWKLGEFLALGKAIISTEIPNRLPKELVANKHIYSLKKNEYIENAILKIKADTSLRSTLENNARKYYEANLKPEVVIKSLLEY